jgi:hypothetical protein
MVRHMRRNYVYFRATLSAGAPTKQRISLGEREKVRIVPM